MTVKKYLENNTLVFDGAMGTYYAQLKDNINLKCEWENIENQKFIENIHKKYIDAGAKAIRTNTFMANEFSLDCEFADVLNIIENGYSIAKRAAKDNAFVFADIGPIALNNNHAYEKYIQIVDVFLNLGAENFVFETFNTFDILKYVCDYIKEKNPNSFILTQFSITPDGYTRQGVSGQTLFDEVFNCKSIDAFGFNCVSGPSHLYEYYKKGDFQNKTMSIMPNAGYPTVVEHRTFFNSSDEYFSNKMVDIVNLGVNIVGGCCGTTPSHIKLLVDKLKTSSNIKHTYEPKNIVDSQVNVDNLLIKKMEDNNKIIAVELDPPLDCEIDKFMENAKRLKKLNVDAITIADCPIGRARVDSSLLACKLKRELDIIPIPHMTCRDRNINATKALLMGLNIEGVNNILVITGDPIPTAHRDEIKAIFNFNSKILAGYINSLNETTFKTPFNICGALNVNATRFESQISSAKKKIEQGVKTFFTQPIFSNDAIKNVAQAKNELNANILGGIMPVVSYRNACFMNNEISGISIPEELVLKYKDIDKDKAKELAISSSIETAKKIAPFVDGFYLIIPFNRVDIIEEIVDEIRNI